MTKAKVYQLTKNKYLADPGPLERLLYLRLNRIDCRDAIMILLALKTGARCSELLNLTASDINEANESVYIKGLKGSLDREIPIPPKLFARLSKHATLNPEKLFPISSRRVRQIWAKFRTESKSFHALRHTFALNLYKKTKDIRLVQVALGHRSIDNTMIYAQYEYSQTELKKALL